jgi:DNA repair protein RecO (recombination protein O)
MLYKTRGIVLKNIKYAENSQITKIYTEKFGLRTYFIKGLSGKNGKARKVLLQSLSLVNLNVYEKQSSDLQYVRDVESAYFFQSVYTDIRKSSILLFLNEIIYKSLKEETPNNELFDFLFRSIVELDEIKEHVSFFHIIFMIRFTKYLGFYPQNSYSQKSQVFDMPEGLFVASHPLHNDFFHEETSRVFSAILEGNYDVFYHQPALRNSLLDNIIRFYSLHVPVFGEIKSLFILKQLFDEQRKPTTV